MVTITNISAHLLALWALFATPVRRLCALPLVYVCLPCTLKEHELTLR